MLRCKTSSEGWKFNCFTQQIKIFVCFCFMFWQKFASVCNAIKQLHTLKHSLLLCSQINLVAPQLRAPGWCRFGREQPVCSDSNKGAARWCILLQKSCLPADRWAMRTRLKVCVRVGPLKEKRRADGSDFPTWRISEMRNSANPAPCAPGSQGPPAYCESLHFASFSRTPQLILGQIFNFFCQWIVFVSVGSFSQITHA